MLKLTRPLVAVPAASNPGYQLQFRAAARHAKEMLWQMGYVEQVRWRSFVISL